MGLSLKALEKSVRSLEEAIEYSKGKIDLDNLDILGDNLRSAIIQKFEYTYELSMKMMRRWLDENLFLGNSEFSLTKMEILKNAYKEGLIDNIDDWVEFGKARNLTSHTYNEDNAVVVYKKALEFLPASKSMIMRLKSKND